MLKKGKNTGDQSPMILQFTLIIVGCFVLISFIPPFSIGSLDVKRANVFSPILHFHDSVKTRLTSMDLLDTSCMTALSPDVQKIIEAQKPAQAATSAAVSSAAAKPSEQASKTVAAAPHPAKPKVRHDTVKRSGIEDYSPYSEMSSQLVRTLTEDSKYRPVHIGFLGDSFIEGDILTTDLRKILQSKLGGCGLGFIPFADPRAANRPVINQTFSGWTTYNLLKKKSVPEHYASEFTITGYLSVPKPGARASFVARSGSNIDCKMAKILFKNRGAAHMDLIINRADTLHYDLKHSEDLQQVSVSGNISTLDVLLPECEDFIGYGVVFEGPNGVSVDNLALRSHSGLNLVGTSRERNSQLGGILEFDLLVLEYGLNVMQKEVTDYTFFANKFKNVVNYLRACFPNTAILVMSIGDVGQNSEGVVRTAPAVRPMVAKQREVAIDCGVMFWDTFHAMGGEGVISKFVENGWASKDYTHMGFKGGRQIALKMASDISDKLPS